MSCDGDRDVFRDVLAHPNARSRGAKDMQARLQTDLQEFAEQQNALVLVAGAGPSEVLAQA